MWLRGRTISFEGTPEVQTRAREVHNGRYRVDRAVNHKFLRYTRYTGAYLEVEKKS